MEFLNTLLERAVSSNNDLQPVISSYFSGTGIDGPIPFDNAETMVEQEDVVINEEKAVSPVSRETKPNQKNAKNKENKRNSNQPAYEARTPDDFAKKIDPTKDTLTNSLVPKTEQSHAQVTRANQQINNVENKNINIINMPNVDTKDNFYSKLAQIEKLHSSSSIVNTIVDGATDDSKTATFFSENIQENTVEKEPEAELLKSQVDYTADVARSILFPTPTTVEKSEPLSQQKTPFSNQTEIKVSIGKITIIPVSTTNHQTTNQDWAPKLTLENYLKKRKETSI